MSCQNNVILTNKFNSVKTSTRNNIIPNFRTYNRDKSTRNKKKKNTRKKKAVEYAESAVTPKQNAFSPLITIELRSCLVSVES